MTQLLGVAKNTYLQTLRQPVYGIIVLVTLGGLAIAPTVTGWTLDDDNKMLRDLGLSTLLIQGLFLACFAASSVLNTEIDDKTVLSVAAKPVARSIFLSGKLVGVFGAIATAHYLAGLVLYMVIRHGVIQAAYEKSDLTVIFLGLIPLASMLVLGAVLNYLFDWRYLPTVVTLFLITGSLSTLILLAIDRDWKIQAYEVTQIVDPLPQEIGDPALFRGIVEFRPDAGQAHLTGHKGVIVRKMWKGPITESDLEYLIGLSSSIVWKNDCRFLADKARELQGSEVFKSGILVLGALGLLTAIAVAVSTRLGLMSTLLICLAAMGIGLTVDHVIRPIADTGALWARIAANALPNFQMFWMVDALADDRVIPWGYVGSAMGYCAVYSLGLLLLGIALFETREVG